MGEADEDGGCQIPTDFDLSGRQSRAEAAAILAILRCQLLHATDINERDPRLTHQKRSERVADHSFGNAPGEIAQDVTLIAGAGQLIGGAPEQQVRKQVGLGDGRLSIALQRQRHIFEGPADHKSDLDRPLLRPHCVAGNDPQVRVHRGCTHELDRSLHHLETLVGEAVVPAHRLKRPIDPQLVLCRLHVNVQLAGDLYVSLG